MDLKEFQKRVVNEVEAYLRAVAAQRAAGNARFASQAAWEDLRLPGRYEPRRNAIGEDLPTVTIKVPTGGGKTLLATQVLGRAYATTHVDRNGAGLVLWVVPSTQIYRDTLRRLSDRQDMYRIMLEHAVGRRIEVWTKDDIRRLSPARLRENLNIFMLMLPAASRETREQLRMFRDSGGAIVGHFPAEDDFEANRLLKQRITNLDMIEDDPVRGRHLCATSVGNFVRLCKPLVILDEGHKATSPLARKTIEDFNASLVVELSATPRPFKVDGIERKPNIVSRVTGRELYDEEMIKLPVNIHTTSKSDWQDVLTKARDKREALATRAAKVAAEAGSPKVIRPIVLVQVERVGKEQERWPVNIHALDVHDYLTRVGVPDTAIAMKTAEDDGLEDVNLDDPDCPITWIITKSALQEGWDCPQAYVLASLNNTGSLTAMTQLVGRILRQPDQRRTPDADLNECYVYVLRAGAGEVVSQVKKVLEGEGYEGEISGMVIDAAAGDDRSSKVVRMRSSFAEMYTRPFAGRIYLPHFCVKTDGEVEPLDYFCHLVSTVDVDAFPYAAIQWELADELRDAKDRFTKVSLGDTKWRTMETEVDLAERDEQVLAWMTATLPFDFLSHKQLRRIVRAVYERLLETELTLRDRLATVKFVVRQKIADFIKAQVDIQTEASFGRLYDDDRLRFYLQCKEGVFEVPAEWVSPVTTRLQRTDGNDLERSLWDYVDASSFDEFEKAIALCLDKDENVLWWYRNLVGSEHFAIQGPRRERIRPDFVAQGAVHKPRHHVYVIEGKGAHLKGNDDTDYKRRVAEYYDKVGKQVSWQQLGADFKDHTFRFRILDQEGDHSRDWKDELQSVLASAS